MIRVAVSLYRRVVAGVVVIVVVVVVVVIVSRVVLSWHSFGIRVVERL